jgi:hypothetical protein
LKTAAHILGLALFLFVPTWWGVSSLAFFNSDTGLRFWQVRDLVATNWQTFAINYPARFLDPDLQFIPLYCAYTILGDDVFFSISPFYPLFASWFYAWLNTLGLTVLPVLSGVLTAAGTYKLATLTGIPRPRLVLWCSVLATPLLFYTVQLWDHSLAMACGIWAVYFTAHGIIRQTWQPVVLAGIVMAFGMGQRPEMYMLALALGLALIIVSWPAKEKAAAFIAGGTVGILPLWWLQYRWVGHPFGILMTHISDFGRPESYVFDCVGPPRNIQVGRFLLYIDARDPWSFAATLLAAFGLFLLIFWLRLPRLQNHKVAIAALLLVVTGYAMWAAMLWQGPLAGLLTTFPLIGLSLAYVDRLDDSNPQRSVYLLALLAALFFLGGMLAFWPAYGGNHFGARYLLPVYPLLLLLAFYVYHIHAAREKTRQMMPAIGATLLITCILLQFLGLRLFWKQTAENKAIQASIAALPARVILTNHPFLPTMLRGLNDQFFMYVDEQADFATLIPRLADQGIYDFAFVEVPALPINVPERVGELRVRRLSAVLYTLEPP